MANLIPQTQTPDSETEILDLSNSFFDKKFSQVKLDYACELTRALGNTKRIQILNFIRSEKNTVVNKIYSFLGIEQSVTSQHLAILRDAKVVDTYKEGKFVHVSVNELVLLKAQKAISNFVE